MFLNLIISSGNQEQNEITLYCFNNIKIDNLRAGMHLQSSLGRSTGGSFYGSLDPYLITQGLGLFYRIPPGF